MLDDPPSFSRRFVTVFQPVNLIALVVGLVVGMMVAVLPGLTLVMGVVLALPFTYGMAITPSIILLTAMYISGTYGGAFTSILFRIPGEPLDVPLLWDGYAMAHKGEPAKALGWTLFAALYGGIVSTARGGRDGASVRHVRAQVRLARVFRDHPVRPDERRRAGRRRR